MKKLLFCFALASAVQFAHAGDEIIGFSRTTSIGVLRGGGDMYRPIPRGGSMSNLTSSDRYRAVIYRPTQHFYLKDNVVSYRYSGQNLSRLRNVHGGTYLGPHAAQFIPSEHQIAPNAGVRNYAAVHKRLQPGVPMVARTTRITRTADAAVTSIQLAKAK